MTKPDFNTARKVMVAEQLKARGISDQAVLQAMADVPRELFIPESHQRNAYHDGALPIDMEQTISQPFIVAWMTELLALQPEDKVLEIGVGSGYQTAILCQLASEIYGIERIPQLAQSAIERLEQLACTSVAISVGDGTLGLPAHAPYDAILVAAAAPSIPEPLIQQLADGGRLVLPVTIADGQEMRLIIRKGGTIHIHRLSKVSFVPLIGAEGFTS